MKNRAYNRIKAVLAEKRLTSLWLSDKLGVHKATVSKWCTNDGQPTMDMLFRIADALEVDVRELLISNRK